MKRIPTCNAVQHTALQHTAPHCTMQRTVGGGELGRRALLSQQRCYHDVACHPPPHFCSFAYICRQPEHWEKKERRCQGHRHIHNMCKRFSQTSRHIDIDEGTRRYIDKPASDANRPTAEKRVQWCGVLQHGAVCCSMLQRIAVCCNGTALIDFPSPAGKGVQTHTHAHTHTHINNVQRYVDWCQSHRFSDTQTDT